MARKGRGGEYTRIVSVNREELRKGGGEMAWKTMRRYRTHRDRGD